MDRHQSEEILLAIKMSYALVGILLVSHYMGCYWYYVGSVNGENDGSSWLVHAKLNYANLEYLYFSSLQWSIAQSGLASVDIHPTNTFEHIYASCVGLVWLSFWPALIGYFTMWLIQVRDANQEQGLQ